MRLKPRPEGIAGRRWTATRGGPGEIGGGPVEGARGPRVQPEALGSRYHCRDSVAVAPPSPSTKECTHPMSDRYASHLEEHQELLPSNRCAATVVLNILDEILEIKSILDLGCGIGVWMEAALREPGRVVFGVDREGIVPKDLIVTPELILNLSLSEKIDLQRCFDLVLCLATADHIGFEHAAPAHRHRPRLY
jgi:hypothetical protein